MNEQDRKRFLWPALAVLVPLVALRGVFSTSRLFFVRDLGAYFWPHHLWLRSTIAAGQWPWWDPNPGLGYAAVADPALQMFFPFTLLVRLLLPEAVGFNVSVALPFPLAALGLYVFLRRHASPAAACLGALSFAISGPVLSTGNCNNLAWCTALVPWTLAVVDAVADRLSTRRVPLLAVVLALGFLAGEPVTFAGTASLALAYAALSADGPGLRSRRNRMRLVLLVATGTVLAVLLSAIQLFPLVDAVRRSIRGAGLLRDGWSLNPIRLGEAIVPGLFGRYLGTPPEIGPWMSVVNDGREPYLISLYLGSAVLLLAVRGAWAGPRRQAFFWAAVAVIGLFWAFGDHAPFYSAARTLVPPLRLFRYPAKVLVFVTLAVAVLTALGWDSLSRPARGNGAALAPIAAGLALVAVGGFISALLFCLPERALAAATDLGSAVGLEDARRGATFLVGTLQWQAPRLLALAAGACTCIWIGTRVRRESALARRVLFLLVPLDLLTTQADLNPTVEASSLRRPEWIAATRQHPGDRVFISQDFLALPSSEPDLPPRPAFPAGVPVVRIFALYGAMIPAFPTAWGVREAISQELTGLRPTEYLDLLELYAGAGREERTRLLQRLGTRYHLLPRPPSPDARRVLTIEGFAPLALYEGPPPFPRVLVAPRGRVEPGTRAQIKRLFDVEFDPRREVLIEWEPPVVGSEGVAQAPRATLSQDDTTRVVVEAGAPVGGGYLVLFDAFDPNWSAEVDGREAPVVRANGLVRAVRLPAGSHTVVFSYRSRSLEYGILASLLGVSALLAISIRGPHRDPRRGTPFPGPGT